jgi:flagellar basal-body rod protein FlgC
MIQLLNGIRSTAAALDAEHVRFDVVSQNLANAHVTRGADGKPYQRQQVIFESLLADSTPGAPPGTGAHTVHISRIDKDTRPFREVFKPDHPDADPRGYVKYPNVNVHEEMVDMIASSRAFEANLAVVKNARLMAQQAMSIGKR